MSRALDWLKRISESVPTEFLQQDLGNEESAKKLLTRPMAFVRADTNEVTTDAARKHAVAKTSRDAMSRCLLDPPASAKETDLLAHLRLTPNDSWSTGPGVELLGAAMAGLPLLEPRWADQVKEADSVEQLAPLGDVIEHAPLMEAKRAARAQLALFVLDEPKEADVPVFTSSSYRFYESMQELKKKDVGELKGAISFGPASKEPHHPDLFWYGVHATEALFTIMGTGCESVTRVAASTTRARISCGRTACERATWSHYSCTTVPVSWSSSGPRSARACSTRSAPPT